MKIAVLGGGITGLSLASFLEPSGHDLDVFEAAPATGGLCASETIDGYVVDRAGGHIIYSTDREVLDVMLSVLGEGNIHESVREARIFHEGRFVTYPFENGLGDLPPEQNYACLKGYVDAAFARRTGAPEPTDFKAWCLWRFGEGICRHFMWPYNEKIWNVDLATLGTTWVRGRVPDAPIDDVLKASIGIKTTGYAHQSVFRYPRRGGFQALVDGFQKRLVRTRVHVRTPCRRLERTPSGWLVDGRPFDRVVSTIPLAELARVLVGVPERVTTALAGLRYTSLVTVFVALRNTKVPPLSWIYFPHADQGPQNRVTVLSNYSPENAPQGGSSYMAEVTYIGAKPDTAAVSRDVVDGLARCGLLKPDDVVFTREFDNHYAYILYEHGLEERLDVVRGYAASIGLDLAGRFGNYNYYNSDRCIRAALDLARTISPK